MFLATTALSDFWDRKREILFLGTWCLRYERQEEWEKLRYQVLPCPWDDKDRLERAYKELQLTHERMLACLAEWLNREHDLDRDIRYWRIVVGPWLQHFLSVLKDRYVCLKDAVSKFQNVQSIGLARESFTTPLDFAEFTALSLDDPYNLQLLTQIMEATGIPFARQACPQLHNSRRLFAPTGMLKRTAFSLLASLTKKSPIHLYLSLPMRQRLALLWTSSFTVWPLPVSIRDDLKTSRQVDEVRRASLLNLSEADEFEKIACKLLPSNLPIAYLEGFQRLRKKSSTRFTPKVIASDVGLHYHDGLKVYIAEMVNAGTSLVGIQHGGGYGLYKRMPVEEHEVTVSDQFWSWGWREDQKVLPVSTPRLAGIDGGEKDTATNRSDIFWVSTMHPRYLYRFHSCPLGPQCEDYLVWQWRFLASVPVFLRDKIVWRPYFQDYGWAVRKRLRDHYPHLRVDSSKRTFRKGMVSSRLLVIDHNATTLLEALVANKPSILFWDPKRWEVRDSAAPFFDALRDAKVLHDTPESAAAHLAKVYEDPWSWWGSETVQAARKRVVQNYANCSSDWVKSWCSALDSLGHPQASRL